MPCFKRLTVEGCDKSYFVPSHRHLEYEAIFVETKGYSASINGSWLECKPGEGVVVKVGDWHEDRCAKGVRFLGMSFTLEGDARTSAPPELFARDVAPAGQRFKCGLQTIMPIVRCIFREDALDDAFSYRMEDALLQQFFWALVRGLPKDSLNPELFGSACDNSFESQLRRLFKENLGSFLTVSAMAARFGMSESSFAHKCSALLGESPQEAFLKGKMEHAQYLLANTGMNVKEVSLRLGYSSEFVFSRAFARRYGEAPSEWRGRYVCWVKS